MIIWYDIYDLLCVVVSISTNDKVFEKSSQRANLNYVCIDLYNLYIPKKKKKK